MRDEIDYDRYSRQILLRDFGADGQRRIGRASVELTGDPSVIEPAAVYLRAAGLGSVAMRRGDDPPGAGSARIDDPPALLHAIAGRDRAACGSAVTRASSPLAPAVALQAAGMLLAIESMKAIVGVGASERCELEIASPS